MIPRLRELTTFKRSDHANIRLGAVLSFVAGASNAGGFLAVGQYTSHMTGLASHFADDIALGQWAIALSSLAAILAFLLGAITTSLTVNWARRRKLKSLYALPLLLEAAMLLIFGLLGAILNTHFAMMLPATVLTLCYTMGLQNAVVTKISHAVIRTTHITGLITDLGIELGKLLYLNRSKHVERVAADRRKMRIQSTLIFTFISGGIIGAIAFKKLGYTATIPLALLLVILSITPLLDDMHLRYRFAKRHGIH